MRPILLKGHGRPLTQLKFNREGDLLFSCAKDNVINLWRSENGERIGTYGKNSQGDGGHSGVVWSVDVNEDSTRLISGSGDQTIKLWDVKTGKELCTEHLSTPVRFVEFAQHTNANSNGNNGNGNNGQQQQLLAVTDQVMGKIAAIEIFTVDDSGDSCVLIHQQTIVRPTEHGRILQARWLPLNERIVTSNQDGNLRVYDVETGKEIAVLDDHKKAVNEICFLKNKGAFITASEDHFCRMYDTRSLKVLKTYATGRPCNAVCFNAHTNHVILGGGQAAENVTTTRIDSAQFRIRFFHGIFQEELASLPGHFGPINSLAAHPDGKCFASGGEDGFIRLHHFDDSYTRLLSDKSIYGMDFSAQSSINSYSAVTEPVR